MVFLIQNTQNRNTAAIQIKPDELITATKDAHNSLLDLEELEEDQLQQFQSHYRMLALTARKEFKAAVHADCSWPGRNLPRWLGCEAWNVLDRRMTKDGRTRVGCTFMILALSMPLMAAEETYLREKSDDGSILILANGTVWEVSSIDRIDSALWFPTEDIIIPDSEDCLINRDNGEKVDARRIK